MINEIPRALAFNNGPICQGESIQLEAEAIQDARYEWRIIGDTSIISTERSPSFNNISRNTVYELTVIANNCNSGTTTTEVIVWQAPVVTPSTNYTLTTDCTPSDLQLFSNVSLGANAIIRYIWTGPNNFNSSVRNPTIPNASAAANGT